MTEKPVRIGFEKLDVVLKDAETVAELVLITEDKLVARYLAGHINCCLPRNGKHLGSAGHSEEVALGAREGVAAFIGIEGVANAEAKDVGFGQSLGYQRAPNVASLLGSDGGDKVDAERRAAQAGGDAIAEGALEPGDGILSFHIEGRLR